MTKEEVKKIVEEVLLEIDQEKEKGFKEYSKETKKKEKE